MYLRTTCTYYMYVRGAVSFRLSRMFSRYADLGGTQNQARVHSESPLGDYQYIHTCAHERRYLYVETTAQSDETTIGCGHEADHHVVYYLRRLWVVNTAPFDCLDHTPYER